MTSAFIQFKDFLREMFQYDSNDLDFGIFKILKLKRTYIEQFISGDGPDDLRATVARELARVENTDVEAAFMWLEPYCEDLGKRTREAWQALKQDPLNPDLKTKLEAAINALDEDADKAESAREKVALWVAGQDRSSANIEERLYNYLLNFFELYYQNGDFGYNSRAANAFKVPYEADYDGSDTFFHWKHKDSYYIKTGASFPSVKCEVAGKKLEFRLETGTDSEAETTAQNSNKDKEIKLYRLARIEVQEGVWQVVFHLAKAGTDKTELYPKVWATVFDADADLTPYLFKKEAGSDPAKPIFNELAADHDKTDSGQVKGVSQLRLKEESYYKELAKRPEFAGLGRNEADRAEALKANPTASALFQLDKALNQFYVGNDADYFIHKDLRGFLTREKDRFIKNVVFSDLDTLLNRNIDNTTLIIGRGFNAVASRIIEFLDTLETFQRNIFTLKKKVIDTHWLISVGKIPARFHAAIAANDGQVRQFSEMYGVTIEDAGQLKEHPTLVVDTSLFAPEWALELLSDPAFDNLDEQTDGVLIHSENWQALNLLQEKYRGQVKCIYIDPPYNTGSDEFLYKDSFKHSSWLSMMHDRIVSAKLLMQEGGLFFISIDRDEDKYLLPTTFDVFGEQNFLEEIVWQKAYGGGSKTKHINNLHEYIIAFSNDKEKTPKLWLPPDPEVLKYYKYKDSKFSTRGKYRTQPLHTNSNDYRENLTYPIPIPKSPFSDKAKWNAEWKEIVSMLTADQILVSREDGEWKVVAVGQDKKEKAWDKGLLFPEKQWQWKWENTRDAIIDDRIVIEEGKQGLVVDYKQYQYDEDGEERGKKPGSIFIGPYTQSGTSELENLFGVSPVKFPKPVGLILNVVSIDYEEKEAIFFDFFAGSGTTGHAITVLNKQDNGNGRRKFVLAEMGTYFDTVLKPRIQKVMYSLNWRDGQPIADQVDGYQGIVKVQRLEQYEDLLANLETAWDGATLPKGLPVQYLFRPEHNKLVASLDLSRPFSQTIKAGKAREEKTIDLMETWLYLQGYWVKTRRVYTENGKKYLAVETTISALIIFRDIDTGEDDSAALNAIIDRYTGESGEPTVTRLEVNFDADIRKVKLPVSQVQAADFDRGASWN